MGKLVERFHYVVTTRTGFRRLVVAAPAMVGAVITISEFFKWIYGEEDRANVLSLVASTFVGIIYLVVTLPPSRASGQIVASHPAKVKVKVEVCDLFTDADAEQSTVVIGISDLVGSNFPEQLGSRTLVAQSLDVLVLDDEGAGSDGDAGVKKRNLLAERLWDEAGSDIGLPLPIGQVTKFNRKKGGSVALVVFARLEAERTRALPSELIFALGSMWEVLAREHPAIIRVPVLGSGFGGARLSRAALISLILTSFRFALEQDRVCDTLQICIRPGDYDPAEMVSAANTLRSLGFE